MGQRRKGTHPHGLQRVQVGRLTLLLVCLFCWEFNIGVCCLLDGSDASGHRGWPAGTGTLPYSMGPETEMGFIHAFIQSTIASHAREEVGARHLVFLTAVLLN